MLTVTDRTYNFPNLATDIGQSPESNLVASPLPGPW
jgi:hypothetical protein